MYTHIQYVYINTISYTIYTHICVYIFTHIHIRVIYKYTYTLPPPLPFRLWLFNNYWKGIPGAPKKRLYVITFSVTKSFCHFQVATDVRLTQNITSLYDRVILKLTPLTEKLNWKTEEKKTTTNMNSGLDLTQCLKLGRRRQRWRWWRTDLPLLSHLDRLQLLLTDGVEWHADSDSGSGNLPVNGSSYTNAGSLDPGSDFWTPFLCAASLPLLPFILLLLLLSCVRAAAAAAADSGSANEI